MAKLFAAALAALALFITAAPAQAQWSCPRFTQGRVLTPGEWQACFDAKQNVLGYTPVNKAGDSMLGLLRFPASTASAAFLNLPQGTAPTVPNNGDVWTTASGIFVRIAGATVGPLSGPTSGSFAGTSPITVSFPASVVTYAFDFSVANVWTATQTFRTLLAGTTNTYDVGTSATVAAFRTIYAGTSFVGPVGTFTTSVTIGAGSAITSSGAGGALGTAAFQAISTSGANVPLLSTANTWTLAQTFTAAPVFSDASGSRTALGLGTAATQTIGTSGATVPLLSTANTWTLGQTFSAAITYGGTTLSNAVVGTGAMVLATAPSVSSLTVTSAFTATGLVANASLATMGAYTFKGNNTAGTAAAADVTIPGLTSKASPAAGDLVMIADSAASNAWKQTTVAALASAGSVASIAGNTGAFTLSNGITNSTNDIRLATIADKTMLANTTGSTAVPVATNLASAGASLALVSCQSASSSASIAFTSLTASTRYILTTNAVTPATDDAGLQLLVGTGGTPTYQATGYLWSGSRVASSLNVSTVFAGNSSTVDSVTTYLPFTTPGAGNGIDNGGSQSGGYTGRAEFYTASAAIAHFLIWGDFIRSDGIQVVWQSGGYWNTGTTITAIKLQMSTGNIGSGEFCLYYRRNS